MGLCRTLLSALSHPRAESIILTDDHEYRKLVAWLENVKIRQYPPESRNALNDVGSPTWRTSFSQYLKDIECPLQVSTENQQGVLEWLLSFAVSLEYADNADELGTMATQALQQQQQAAAGRLPFPDLRAPEAQQQLSTLFRLLHVDTSQGNLLDHLQAAREALSDSVLPSVTDASVRQTVTTGSLEHVPLGFETGDAQIDALATVLRLLYIKDLRHLQTTLDRVVVQVQEYTANPKTDASLGKVGR